MMGLTNWTTQDGTALHALLALLAEPADVQKRIDDLQAAAKTAADAKAAAEELQGSLKEDQAFLDLAKEQQDEHVKETEAALAARESAVSKRESEIAARENAVTAKEADLEGIKQKTTADVATVKAAAAAEIEKARAAHDALVATENAKIAAQAREIAAHEKDVAERGKSLAAHEKNAAEAQSKADALAAKLQAKLDRIKSATAD